MACVVLGDSIAVGVGQNMPECEVSAKVGVNSDRYITTLMPPGRFTVESAVISLGVNDDTTVDTLSNLRNVRSRISSRAVTWLLPGLKPDVRDMIRTVAAENGDRTVDTRPQVGADHLHPTGTGYRIIAAAVTGGNADNEVAEYEAPSRPYYPRGHYTTVVERIHGLRTMRQSEMRYSDIRSSDMRPSETRHSDARHSHMRYSELRHADGRFSRTTHMVQHVSQGHAQRSMRVAVRMTGTIEPRHVAAAHGAHSGRVRS